MSRRGRRSSSKSRSARCWRGLRALAASAAGLAIAAAIGCGRADRPAAGAARAPWPPPGFSGPSAAIPSWDGRHLLFSGRRGADDAPRIWEMRADGSGLRAVTAGNGDPADPIYLPDARVLYADRPAAGAESGVRALFACAPDGTGADRLTFSHHRDARPLLLPDGRVRFERRPAGSDPSAPALEMTIHPDGTGLAAYLGRPAAATAPTSGLPARPPLLTSVVRPGTSTGTLLCLDVYESRLEAISRLPRGSIDRVRVSPADPPDGGIAPAAGGPGTGGAAEAPVYADGSFFVEVPADVPLRIALLGRDGRELAALRSGLWVRPNENRGCIGCHEDPHLAPRNAQPLAVRQAAAPLAGRIAGGSLP